MSDSRVGRAAAYVRSHMVRQPQIAIVLGSGLQGVASTLQSSVTLPYEDIPHFPVATVPGHAGCLLSGLVDQVPVILQSGRFHLYEGYDLDDVVLPVRVFAELGIDVLIVTNAAGGIHSKWRVPSLMLIASHVNFMFRNPLIGSAFGRETRFPDMCEAYDPQLRGVAHQVARDLGIHLYDGVYGGVLGPSYETPSEVLMLEHCGVDAVGMSTVPEVVVARANGMRVLAVSTITNFAAGKSHEPLTHGDVIDKGKQISSQLQRLVTGLVARLADVRGPCQPEHSL